jgi:CIC family chloride channel protein
VNERILSRAQQLMLREDQVFLAVTIVVGVLAGLSAVLFSLAIEFTSRTFFGLSPSWPRLLAVPPLVSLLTGVLLAKVFPDVRGSGVPQTEAAYHLSGGIIRPRVPLGKFLTGVLCVGSGHSMGREGPSVQIGAGIASSVGQWLGLAPERVRALVPVGAAGALAAAFNTPVAAVLFALEEVIGNMNAAVIGSIVVASVASVVVERSLLGNEPLFHVPVYHLVHPAELAIYAVLGVVGGAISVGFCRVLLAARGWFQRLPVRTRVLQPALGGVAIGALLLLAPGVMGVGYEYVDQTLNGGLVFSTMVTLGFLKLCATTISYSSGNAGGIFAPTLYVGAMLGGALGSIVHTYAPFPTGDVGAYALVGMGALFAGVIRAPMTSVFMIFEITQDYQILVPLMVANMLSFAISRRYQRVPVYHALLHQDGIHLPMTEPETEPAWTARHMMRPETALLPGTMRVADAWQRCAGTERQAWVVGTTEDVIGIVSRSRLSEALSAGQGDFPVAELVTDVSTHVHPDHPVDVVLERYGRTPGVLPVVSRANARRLEGVVTLETIIASLVGLEGRGGQAAGGDEPPGPRADSLHVV